MKKTLAWLEANPFITVIATLVLAALLWYATGAMIEAVQRHQVNKQDHKLEKQIEAADQKATQAESNANDAGNERIEAEGRAARALEEKQQAAANSNRTLDPVRKARQRYEETRRSSPADAPAISDAELCAELAKRSIPCR